jgi:hypothetical protein
MGYSYFGGFCLFDLQTRRSASLKLDRMVKTLHHPFFQENAIIFPAMCSGNNQVDQLDKGRWDFAVDLESMACQATFIGKKELLSVFSELEPFSPEIEAITPGISSATLSRRHVIVLREPGTLFELYVDGFVKSSLDVPQISGTEHVLFFPEFLDLGCTGPLPVVATTTSSTLVVLSIQDDTLSFLSHLPLGSWFTGVSWTPGTILLWKPSQVRLAEIFPNGKISIPQKWTFVSSHGKLELLQSSSEFFGDASPKYRIFMNDLINTYVVKKSHFGGTSEVIDLSRCRIFSHANYSSSNLPDLFDTSTRFFVSPGVTLIYWFWGSEFHALEISNYQTPTYLPADSENFPGAPGKRVFRWNAEVPKPVYMVDGCKYSAEFFRVPGLPGCWLAHGLVRTFLLDAHAKKFMNPAMSHPPVTAEPQIRHGMINFRFPESRPQTILRSCGICMLWIPEKASELPTPVRRALKPLWMAHKCREESPWFWIPDEVIDKIFDLSLQGWFDTL